MSEKKRKRQGDNAERPSKKVAFNPPANVKVTVLPSDELPPVVAATPGLSIPSSVSFKTYKRNVKPRILPPGYQDIEGGSNGELVLHSQEHHRLDYTARREIDGSADSHLKHYVGVFDPKSGDLKIMEAEKLVVRTTLRSEVEEMRQQQEVQEEANRPTAFSQRTELGMAFGTKKAKKALASLTENAITPSETRATSPGGSQKTTDPLASAVLESIAASVSNMPDRAALQEAVDEAKPRPKPNLKAAAPAEVYSPESLIGAETLGSIEVKDWQEAVESNQNINTTSRFVARRLNALAKGKRTKELKILRYIGQLIDFVAACKTERGGGKKMLKRDDMCAKMNAGAAIVDGIRRKFTQRGEMTKWHVDNLITHIAAMTLLVDNFETDVFDVREDLRLENKQIKQYFHELGCKVNGPTEAERKKINITKQEGGSHWIAKLKIPLDFPRQRVIAQKSR